MLQNSNSSKIAGKTAVKQAAEHLMLSNGETTTLGSEESITTTRIPGSSIRCFNVDG